MKYIKLLKFEPAGTTRQEKLNVNTPISCVLLSIDDTTTLAAVYLQMKQSHGKVLQNQSVFSPTMIDQYNENYEPRQLSAGQFSNVSTSIKQF